ncbi:MAG: hypothetical protein ACOYT4_04330 [Nanoarchaeota archaeon]
MHETTLSDKIIKGTLAAALAVVVIGKFAYKHVTLNQLPAEYRSSTTFTRAGLEKVFSEHPCDADLYNAIKKADAFGWQSNYRLESGEIDRIYNSHCLKH